MRSEAFANAWARRAARHARPVVTRRLAQPTTERELPWWVLVAAVVVTIVAVQLLPFVGR